MVSSEYVAEIISVGIDGHSSLGTTTSEAHYSTSVSSAATACVSTSA